MGGCEAGAGGTVTVCRGRPFGLALAKLPPGGRAAIYGALPLWGRQTSALLKEPVQWPTAVTASNVSATLRRTDLLSTGRLSSGRRTAGMWGEDDRRQTYRQRRVLKT